MSHYKAAKNLNLYTRFLSKTFPPKILNFEFRIFRVDFTDWKNAETDWWRSEFYIRCVFIQKLPVDLHLTRSVKGLNWKRREAIRNSFCMQMAFLRASGDFSRLAKQWIWWIWPTVHIFDVKVDSLSGIIDSLNSLGIS